jgi:hypothetical protein
MILELMGQSQSCLQGFSTKYAMTLTFDFGKQYGFSFHDVIKCTKLCGPEAYGSVSILPTRLGQTDVIPQYFPSL